jgi:tRNA-dihydrouridine synthase
VVHGRTVKEESKVPCHWDEIGKAKQLQSEIQKDLPVENQTLMIGNGDIVSYAEGKQKALEYNLNGIMIGRGVFHNPWIFNPDIYSDQQGNLTHTNGKRIELIDRLNLLSEHLALWHTTWGETKNYQILKKYFKIYISGFPGSSDLRNKLMSTNTLEEAHQLVTEVKLHI